MAFRGLIPPKPLAWWQGLLVAVALTAAVWFVRASMAELLGAETPYTLFIAGVLVSAIVGGMLPGAVAALLGGMIANWSFVGAGGEFNLDGPHLWGLVAFWGVSALVIGLAETMTAALRREAALSARLAVIGRELQHRVKNVLTVTQALAQQTSRSAASVAEFRTDIIERLHALARAQDLLTEVQDRPVLIRTLLEQILAPFDLASRWAVPLAGPEVEVRADLAISLSLLLNELATNSVKYGALSTPQGRIRLVWNKQPQGVRLEWKELGGPPVAAPRRKGFGSQLFKTALPRSQGAVQIHFEGDGVRCEIRLAAT